MTEIVLLEPSFADAAKAIEMAGDLPVATRAYWLCALRQVAKAIGKPPETIPARWTSARIAIDRLHHAEVEANPKTLANHKSNARAALSWFAGVNALPSRGIPFTADWEALRSKLSDKRSRAVLSSFMRFCSAHRVLPAMVSEAVVDDYMRYRAEMTALAVGAAARRCIARVWNGCIGKVEGWPTQKLEEPAIKAAEGPSWDRFPEGLRADLERYLAGLARVRRNTNGRRMRPCKPSTIRTRGAEIVAAARTAVREGVLMSSLTSLAALLHPAVAEKVIDAYWRTQGEPTTYTIDLCWKFVSVARQVGGVEEVASQRLCDIHEELETHRHDGLTPKNKTLIRQVISGDVWRRVLGLPAVLLGEAHDLRAVAPIKAAVKAQVAVAIVA